MSIKLLHEPETKDPILSVVNLIDIFLVVIAALLITIAQLVARIAELKCQDSMLASWTASLPTA